MLNKPADQDGAGVALPEIRPAFAVLFLAFLYLALSNRVELVQHLGNWHDQQRFLQLLLLAFVALATAIYPPAGMPRTAIVLLGLALASGLTAAQPGWAFAEVAVFLGLILTVYWCRIAFRGALQVDPQPLMLGLLVLGALSLLLPLVVTVAIFLDDRAVREIHALFDGYSNRRFFSQTQSILLPLLLLPLFATRATQNMRRASWVLCTGFWVLAFAVGTRAFYVATLAGAVFAWWFSPAAGRAWVKMQARAAGIGLLIYLVVFVLGPQIFGFALQTDNIRLREVSTLTSTSNRWQLWMTALQLSLGHPLLGIGPMQFATLPMELNAMGVFTAHPHNTVVQLCVEFGMPFAALSGWIVSKGFIRHFRAARNPGSGDAQRDIFAISLLVAAVYSLLDGSIVMPYTQVLFSVVLGWGLAISDVNAARPFPASANRPTAGRRGPARLAGGLSALLCALFLGWLALYPYSRLPQDIRQYLDAHPSVESLNPRFWIHGLINVPDDLRYPAWAFAPAAGACLLCRSAK